MTIDDQYVGFPDEATMSTDQGLFANHYYRDMRGFDEEDFARIWADEETLLAYEGDLGSDEAYEEFQDNELFILDLDPGVASTVVALSAIGACPYSSCSGDPGHRETHPLVVFWADQDILSKVLESAATAGVEVEGVEPTGIIVYTLSDVSLMREFAQVLMGQR